MPRDEIEMAILIKQVKHQAKIYRSLYKHWRETAERVSCNYYFKKNCIIESNLTIGLPRNN